MSFYANFVRLCNSAEITPTEASRRIGFDKSAVTRWKKDDLYPSYKTLVKIADYFGVDPSFLVEDIPLCKSAGEMLLTSDEAKLVEAWRKTPMHDKEIIAFLLKDYGFEFYAENSNEEKVI